MQSITFIELPNFTRHLYDYLTEGEYDELQYYLMSHPEAGDLIAGSGGCRRIRWAAKGRGKRGGVRIIYYLRRLDGQIWMLSIFAKDDTDNIDLRTLRALKEKIDRAK